MTIKKQVVLDGHALEAYNKLRESFPFINDSHLIRGALIVASRVDIDEIKKACMEASLKVGKPSGGGENAKVGRRQSYR